MDSTPNYYEMLDLPSFSDIREVKQKGSELIGDTTLESFEARRLELKSNRRRRGQSLQNELAKIDQSRQRFELIKQAYEVLSDPERKNQYDLELQAQSVRPNIKISPKEIDFGPVLIRELKSKPFSRHLTIDNVGGNPEPPLIIEWERQEGRDLKSIGWATLDIHPNMDDTFPIDVVIALSRSVIKPRNQVNAIQIRVGSIHKRIPVSAKFVNDPTTYKLGSTLKRISKGILILSTLILIGLIIYLSGSTYVNNKMKELAEASRLPPLIITASPIVVPLPNLKINEVKSGSKYYLNSGNIIAVPIQVDIINIGKGSARNFLVTASVRGSTDVSFSQYYDKWISPGQSVTIPITLYLTGANVWRVDVTINRSPDIEESDYDDNRDTIDISVLQGTPSALGKNAPPNLKIHNVWLEKSEVDSKNQTTNLHIGISILNTHSFSSLSAIRVFVTIGQVTNSKELQMDDKSIISMNDDGIIRKFVIVVSVKTNINTHLDLDVVGITSLRETNLEDNKYRYIIGTSASNISTPTRVITATTMPANLVISSIDISNFGQFTQENYVYADISVTYENIGVEEITGATISVITSDGKVFSQRVLRVPSKQKRVIPFVSIPLPKEGRLFSVSIEPTGDQRESNTKDNAAFATYQFIPSVTPTLGNQ